MFDIQPSSRGMTRLYTGGKRKTPMPSNSNIGICQIRLKRFCMARIIKQKTSEFLKNSEVCRLFLFFHFTIDHITII